MTSDLIIYFLSASLSHWDTWAAATSISPSCSSTKLTSWETPAVGTATFDVEEEFSAVVPVAMVALALELEEELLEDVVLVEVFCAFVVVVGVGVDVVCGVCFCVVVVALALAVVVVESPESPPPEPNDQDP